MLWRIVVLVETGLWSRNGSGAGGVMHGEVDSYMGRSTSSASLVLPQKGTTSRVVRDVRKRLCAQKPLERKHVIGEDQNPRAVRRSSKESAFGPHERFTIMPPTCNFS